MKRGILVFSICILSAILIFLASREVAYRDYDNTGENYTNNNETESQENAGVITESTQGELPESENYSDINGENDIAGTDQQNNADSANNEDTANIIDNTNTSDDTAGIIDNNGDTAGIIDNDDDSVNAIGNSEYEGSSTILYPADEEATKGDSSENEDGRSQASGSVSAENETTMTESAENETVSIEPAEEVSSDSPENSESDTDAEKNGDKSILVFLDAYKEVHQAEIDNTVKKHDYDLSCFKSDGNITTYEGDERYSYRLGIDVSHHDGNIDWEAVKDAGIEFAILRIAYRGYGLEGILNEDKKFREYIDGAHASGLDVGCYVFSQAINTQEAEEEAQLAIDILKDYELELPVVYDPESILDANARTDYVSGEQFTENAIAFCEKVKAAGYDTMIYSNMMWEAFQFDMKKLEKYPFWYADYEPLPQTPYDFLYWQYSNTGRIPGVEGTVDLDIQLSTLQN